ncbi:MAG: serine hydrolase, partial [Bacteroidales bacterium]|nr:serine hydrolase [Bacteroidales bacterium]
NWDDKVKDHFHEFQMYDPYITKEFRIDDLLCHRSGLITFDGDLLWYGSDYDRKEIVRRIRYRKNENGFREKFGYQNVMYITAGELIEEVSGKTWDEFIQEKIFEPLNMTSTSTTNSSFTENMNIAYPHIDGEPLEFLNYDNCGPAASINTSVDDLLKWVELMLNKGVYKNDTIFSEKEYYTLTSPHTILNAGPGEKINGTHFYSYGLGWFIYDYQGRKIIQHGGGLPGFHSKVVFIPEDSVGYVILANQLSGLVPAIDKKILDFLLLKPEKQDEAKDWASIYLQGKKKQEERKMAKEKEKLESRISGTEPSLELNKYTGIYEDEMYGTAEIKLENDQLHLTLLPSKKLFTSKMEHWQNNTFRIKFNDPFLPEGFVSFKIDKIEGVQHFTIDLENPDFHFYKLKFEKVK